MSDAFEERQQELRQLFTQDDSDDNIYYMPREDYDSDEEYNDAVNGLVTWQRVTMLITWWQPCTISTQNITLNRVRITQMSEQIMTVKDVASYLKLNERTVYRMATSAKIPAFKVGTSWRFKREDIEKWIEEQKNDRQ